MEKLSFFLLLLLTLNLTSAKIKDGKGSDKEKGGNCKGVKCQPVPGDADCTEVSGDDPNIPMPKGPKMECCPLMKCTKGGNTKKYFTFHGITGKGAEVDGGSETVHYEETEAQGRSVTSSATKGHDSVANAATKEEMDELAAALAEAGIS